MFRNIFKNFILNYLFFLILISNENIIKGQRRYYRRRYQPQYQQRGLHLDSPENSCVTSLRKPGLCVVLSACSEALFYLKHYRLQPQICDGHNPFNPIICCGTSTESYGQHLNSRIGGIEQPQPRSERQTQKHTTGERISAKKCYEQYLPAYGRTSTPTIVGGTKTYPGEFSYMAAIGWPKGYGSGYDFRCGGSLIAKRFVLTAGHCCNLGGSAPSIVETGGLPLNSGQGIVIKVSDVFPHPEYDTRYHYNDIGLIKLVDYAPQTPACLLQNQNLNLIHAIAVGYGTTAFAGKYSKDLLKINVRTYSHQECQPYFPPNHIIPYGLSSSHLCAGNPGKGRDTCQGDSGGPLITKGNVQSHQIPFIIGVTSFGQNCAGNAPGVYTKVANYLDWIESIVWVCKVRRGSLPRRTKQRKIGGRING